MSLEEYVREAVQEGEQRGEKRVTQLYMDIFNDVRSGATWAALAVKYGSCVLDNPFVVSMLDAFGVSNNDIKKLHL